MKAGTFLTVALLALSASAAEPQYDLRPMVLADGVYMLEGKQEYFSRDNGGAIANIGILTGANGVTVIDTGPSAAYGRQLRQLAEKLGGKPVTLAINTHLHPDHMLGNVGFDKATLAASAETVDLIRRDGQSLAENMYRLAGDWMTGTEPVTPATTLKPGPLISGGRKLQIIALSGHTPSDVAVLDEESGTLFAGDLVFNGRAPTTPHADVAAWRASLDKLRAIPFKTLVPGHGPAAHDDGPIRATADYLDWQDKTLHEAARDGLSMTETMRLPLPERFAGLALARAEFERSVIHLYPAIEAATLPPR